MERRHQPPHKIQFEYGSGPWQDTKKNMTESCLAIGDMMITRLEVWIVIQGVKGERLKEQAFIELIYG